MLYDEVISIAKKLPLDEYGRLYLEGMRQIDPNDETAIRTQALYIANNALPKTEEQRELWHKLNIIGNWGKEYDPEVAEEILLDKISQSFERFTESKVRNMPDEEDIWELEDSDVLKCSGKPNELEMGNDACYIMDKWTHSAFNKLSPDIQQKVREFAKQYIVFDSIGVYTKVPNTRHPGGYGYTYDDKVTKYCRDKGSTLPEVIACEIESTITGRMGDKPYDEWRIDAVRDIIKDNYYLYENIDVLTPEERDAEVERLKKERDMHKVSLDDFKRFSERYGYPLNEVLKANPWVSDVLADDAKLAIDKLNEKLKISI